MPENEISGPEQADRSIVDKLWSKRAELLWGLVVVIMLLTFVDPVVLIGLALVLATIVAGWAGFHELMDRANRTMRLRPRPHSAPRRHTRRGRAAASPKSWQVG